MCSTMAGPRRGSAPAGNIIPSCRSRCRSRRCRARGCSGPRPQQLLAAIEAVTVQNDMSSAHITFIDDAGAAECERRGWLIRHGVQYHWFNRGYASFDDFLGRADQPQAQGDPQGTGGGARRARVPPACAAPRSARRLGRDVGLLPGHRLAQMGPALSHPRVLRSRRRADGRPVLLFLACRDGLPIAGALNFIGPDTLYGRYWGCDRRSAVPPFRALLLPGDRMGDRAWPRAASRPARRASTRSRAAMSR